MSRKRIVWRLRLAGSRLWSCGLPEEGPKTTRHASPVHHDPHRHGEPPNAEGSPAPSATPTDEPTR